MDENNPFDHKINVRDVLKEVPEELKSIKEKPEKISNIKRPKRKSKKRKQKKNQLFKIFKQHKSKKKSKKFAFSIFKRKKRRVYKKSKIKSNTNPYTILILLIIGVTFLWLCLTAPCKLGESFENNGVGGFASYIGTQITGHSSEEADLDLPDNMEKAVCIYTNFGVLFLFLAGVTFTTSGLSILVKRALS